MASRAAINAHRRLEYLEHRSAIDRASAVLAI
jgi:hypothetical protein